MILRDVLGSTLSARATHARQVKGDVPDKKGYSGLTGWGLGVGLNDPTPTQGSQTPPKAVALMMMMTTMMMMMTMMMTIKSRMGHNPSSAIRIKNHY